MSTSRRYTDDEVHAIFERAAARQEEATRAEEASGAGLALEELQEIGVEAGIDPAHIALAASELAVRGASGKKEADEAFLGIPTRIGTSRVIRGHVTDNEWERMVVELRGIFGRDGIAGEIGRVREWTATSSIGKFDRPTKVTLTPRGDDTLVTIKQEMRSQAKVFSIGAGLYLFVAFAIGLASVLGTGAADNPPIGVALLFLLVAALVFSGAQIGTRIYASRQREKFDRALDRIELVAREAQPEVLEREFSRPRIDLDALPDAPDSVSDKSVLRQRERE